MNLELNTIGESSSYSGRAETPLWREPHAPEHTPTLKTVETLIVADSQLAFAELLANQLRDSRGCRHFELASSVEDVVSRIGGCSDVLILSETRIPGGGITALIDRCRALGSSVRIAVLSNPLSELQKELYLHLPIVGIANKHLPLNQLLAELHKIIQRREPLKSDSDSRAITSPESDAPEAIICQLNPRQYQVLLLLAEGLSVKLVAQRLKVSVKTVDSLKYRLMKQLQFHDRVELTRFAIREGLIDP